MATLMDTIAQQQKSAPEQIASASTTAPQMNVQQLTQAASGKAASGVGGIAASQQQVLAAKQANQAQQQQQQAAGQQQAVQLQQQQAAQQQQFAQQKAKISEQSARIAEQAQRQTTALMNELAQGKERLGAEQYAAKVQQATQGIRLANDKYLTNLDARAQQANLADDISFSEEMQRAIWNDESNLFNSNMEFQNLLQADQRSFQAQLARMDLDTAIALAKTEAKAAGAQQMASGVGTLASAEAMAYAKSPAAPESKASQTTTDNPNVVAGLESNEATQSSQMNTSNQSSSIFPRR